MLFNNPGSLAISPSSVQLLLTNTADESAFIFSNVALPPSMAVIGQIVGASLGAERLNTLMASGQYSIPNGSTDGRPTLSHLLTDIMFRCPAREVARKWAAAGGKVYIAEWRQGVPYPFNARYTYCRGKVCHNVSVRVSITQSV